MDSLIYPEDGIVEVILEQKPNRNNAIYADDLRWDGTVEVANDILLTSEHRVELIKRAFRSISYFDPKV